MARSLDTIVQYSFNGTFWHHCFYDNTVQGHTDIVKYMEIPVNEDSFEVPLFALPTFIGALMDNRLPQTDALVVCLKAGGVSSGYSSLERIMKDVMIEKWISSKLVTIPVKLGDDIIYYYGTGGAVFDCNFNPIMICSWQVEQYIEESVDEEGNTHTNTKYRYVKPIIRISRIAFVEKRDAMERFLSNKYANTCLMERVTPPTLLRDRKSIKLEVDEFPFRFLQTDVPSISTSNQELLELAANHIDDIVQ